MAMNGRQRRDLTTRSHRLKPLLTIGDDGLTDGVVDQVRHCLSNRDLIKVRLPAQTGKARTALAADLAGRIPCELVRCVGRIALLFKPLDAVADDDE